jgi:Raf kinase inhibitor-like YbhB/YbcL family protein
MIPLKYTCDGLNINPPLEIRNIPLEARSLALIVEDPDAPAGTWIHWVVWNIPIRQHIKENSVPGIEGINDFKQYYYGGPCPPSGTHRYYFKVYALDTMLDIPHHSTSTQLEKGMSEHIIAFGELMGMYKRNNIAGNKESILNKAGKKVEDFFISVVF